jgi:methylenetetrahydrofolate reductase (NADPH)
MTGSATTSGADARSARTAALLRDSSLEATLPDRAELAALREMVAPATAIYLSAPPSQTPQRLVEQAKAVRDAGLQPVPHLAARRYPDAATLEDTLARLHGEAGVIRALLIGGDVDPPSGPFSSALDLIESGLLGRHGIAEIGLAGYPEGHPSIGDGVLARALTAKRDAAAAHGLRSHIVSQICFDGARIVAWLRALRRAGIDDPVRIGLAGPTGLRALLRYALRCGVRASAKHMPTGLQLLGEATPDGVMQMIAAADDLPRLGPLSLHVFSFGGLVRTAEWMRGAATRQPQSAAPSV